MYYFYRGGRRMYLLSLPWREGGCIISTMEGGECIISTVEGGECNISTVERGRMYYFYRGGRRMYYFYRGGRRMYYFYRGGRRMYYLYRGGKRMYYLYTEREGFSVSPVQLKEDVFLLCTVLEGEYTCCPQDKGYVHVL